MVAGVVIAAAAAAAVTAAAMLDAAVADLNTVPGSKGWVGAPLLPQILATHLSPADSAADASFLAASPPTQQGQQYNRSTVSPLLPRLMIPLQ